MDIRQAQRTDCARLSALIALLEEADAFFRRHGCRHVEVTSAAQRHDAHRFYVANGYRDTPKRFVKAYGP